MKKLNELKDTLEEQERKEFIFYICWCSIPFIFLLVTFLIVYLLKV